MLVFSADWHLSPIIWANKPHVTGDAYFSAEQVVDFCVKNAKKVDGLILGGDIFDRNQPDSGSVMFFRNQIDRLQEAEVPVFAIEGQHDLSRPPWTDVHYHVKHLWPDVPAKIEVDGQQHVLSGVDYTPAAQLRELIEKTPADILVLHQMHKDAIDFEGAWNFDPAWLPKSVKLVLMGDLHVAREDLGICHYSGSTHLRSIDEPREKVFLTVKGLKKGFKVEKQPIVTRDVLEFTIDSDNDLQRALATVKGYAFDKIGPIEFPLVVAHINPAVESARAKFEAGLAELEKPVNFMPYVARRAPEEIKTAHGDEHATLQSCLSKLVDPEKDAELHSFVLSLLESQDIAATLSEHKKRLGVA